MRTQASQGGQLSNYPPSPRGSCLHQHFPKVPSAPCGSPRCSAREKCYGQITWEVSTSYFLYPSLGEPQCKASYKEPCVNVLPNHFPNLPNDTMSPPST